MERNNERINAIWKPLCLMFAALLALSWVFFGVLYSKGGVDFSTLENPEQSYTTDNGGAIIGESTGNGVSLMSAKIAPEDFAVNGVSPLAESAYTLTATITPDNADNKAVDWMVSFVNPASAWASGKNVSDYVTVTPTSDGALIANVECMQAFGEQIRVTVTSRDNVNATASCSVDYVQKVLSASLNFGSVSVNLDGVTNMSWQVNANAVGFGGNTDLTYQTSEAYTLADTFSVKVELLGCALVSSGGPGAPTFGGNPFMSPKVVFGEVFSDITNSGLVLDRAFLESFDYWYDTRQGGVHLNEMSESDFLECLSSIEQGKVFDVKVSVIGEYSSCVKSSTINIIEFVNTVSVTNVTLDKSNHVF